MQKLDEDKEYNLTAKVSRIVKSREKRKKTHLAIAKGTLQREKFTQFASRKFHSSPDAIGENFTIPDGFFQDFTGGIMQLSPNKAAFKDGIFYEALSQNVPANATILIKLWEACSRTGCTPKIWNHILLFPIFKQGDRRDASNYTPNALMSHVRKLLERPVSRSNLTSRNMGSNGEALPKMVSEDFNTLPPTRTTQQQYSI